MKFAPKTLALGFGFLVVVWAVLFSIERKVMASKAQAGLNKLLGPRASGVEEENTAKRERLKRARKLSSVEAEQLLKDIIIPRVDLEDTSLEEALDFLNAEIAKQIPEDQPRPMVKLDQVYLKAERESKAAYQVRHQEGLVYPTFDQVEIGELRVINIPAEVLLGYICDATSTRYWLFEGNAYLSPYTGPSFGGHFLYEEILSKVDLADVPLERLQREMNEIIRGHEYYGYKAGIDFKMSKKAREALLSGEVTLPKINLEMESVTMVEIMESICKLPNIHHAHIGLGEIIYDPLNEFVEHAARVDPFAPVPDENNPFIVPLDENWRTWKAPEIKVKHFSTSKEELPELLLEE